MENYNKLMETLQKIKRAEERLKVLIENKVALEQKVREKKLVLEKEVSDIDKLDGFSLVGFIHLIKGSLIDQLDKEEREAMIAKNQYEFACQELDVCLKEIALTKDRIKDKHDLERQYSELLKNHEKQLLEEERLESDEVKGLLNDLYNETEIIREITEAETAGQQLLGSFKCIQESFTDADSLEIIDVLESGLLVSACGHEQVKSTNEKLVLIQQEIRKYHLELLDVFQVCDVEFNQKKWLSFSDLFLENVIHKSDYKVKIEVILKLLVEVIEDTEESLHLLLKHKQEAMVRSQVLKDKKQVVIENYMKTMEM